MGNFHCVPEGCAEVRYQPYEKSGGIRYRYGNEDWQVVDGDDYTIDKKDEIGACPVLYHAFGTFVQLNNSNCGYLGYWRTEDPINGEAVDNWNPVLTEGNYVIQKTNGDHVSINQLGKRSYETKSTGRFRGYGIFHRTGSSGCINTNIPSYGFNVKLTDVSRLDGGDDDCGSGNCTLKIYKKEKIVFEKTRDSCPEVEKLDDACECDRTHVIKVEKSPYLERVEVRNQSIETIYVSPLEAPLIDTKPLPENCLNIYQTYVAAPPILSNYVPLPGAINPYQFIAQICSAEGCPPPKYEVICTCDGEECPDGTCAIVCGETVCCADSNTGHTVESIPLSEYGGEL